MEEHEASYLRQRSSNWSERDKLLAIELVLAKEDELYGLCKGKCTNRMKQDSWLNVAEEFNLKADEIRTADQLKKCFENIRSSARKYVEDLKLAKTTGGLMPRQPKPSVKLIIDKIRKNPHVCRINMPSDAEDSDVDAKWKITKLPMDDSCPMNKSITDSEESSSTHTKEYREPTFDGQDSSHQSVGDQDSQHSSSYSHTTQASKRKYSLQDILLQCELDQANLVKQKLSLEINMLEEKRQQDRSLFEAKMEILRLKKQCIRNDIALPLK